MLSFWRMKRTLRHALIPMLVLVWPAAELLSAPSRFSEPSIALETDEPASKVSVAKLNPSMNVTPSRQLDNRHQQDEQQAKHQAQSSMQMLAEQNHGADTLQDMTISEALSRDESDSADAMGDAGQEVIEWVGKDRRIKRVKKVLDTVNLKSLKPANKLIITDDYHHSKIEMLGTAGIRHYGARPEESKWLYSGSKFLCELRHPIPGFGYVVMTQGVDDSLQFQVESNGLLGGSGLARIQSRPPVWKRFTLVKDLGVVTVEPRDNILFSISSEWVKRLTLELQEGMQPTISFWDDDTGGEDVVLTVSYFNFQKHLPDFSKCLGNLLPYSFKDVRKRTVYFGYDKYKLSSAQRERLKKVIEYVKLDETVKKVDITGFSDSVGFARYNKTLARRRANSVKKYLLAQGLPASKLAVKSKGEKGKKHSNRTSSGRSKNRRVVVTLIK